ncbi:hypothetical protein I6Y99_003338 [Vibrio parahaemolyticus]|nr:hypothetical protein [Vibrio parahaemolyticus]EGQ7792751.1 hypothetical protein [Vibrio parahaemolyticus]EGQ7809353.1 hypothetical protein [Vibrio parahaemolyticus]EGQ8533257.1 hypothetical protein [Vibrio parahaemolyticus]EIV8648098.1 hypothetical protein [Vibrio parahaemolyticus]EJE4732858.1 hypothetical protein [Vibrio parahaemolyticus]
MSEAIQEYSAPYHSPCPDMAAYSLTQEQKIQGLEKLKQVKANLKESRLRTLLSDRAVLVEKGENSQSTIEQSKLKRQIKLIDLEASRLKQRWN